MHPDDYDCTVKRKSTVAATGMISSQLATATWQVVSQFASFPIDSRHSTIPTRLHPPLPTAENLAMLIFETVFA